MLLPKLQAMACKTIIYRHLSVQARRLYSNNNSRSITQIISTSLQNELQNEEGRCKPSGNFQKTLQSKFIQDTLEDNKLGRYLHISQPDIESHIHDVSRLFQTTQLTELAGLLLPQKRSTLADHHDLERGAQQVAFNCLQSIEGKTSTPDQISHLLWGIHPLHPYIDTPSVKQDLTTRVNKLAISNLPAMDFIGLCRLMHFNIAWPLPPSGEAHVDRLSLMNRLVKQCRTSSDLLLLNYLVYQLKSLSEQTGREFSERCGEIHRKTDIKLQTEFNKLAVTCLTLFSCDNKGVAIYRRDFLSLVWEAIAHHGSRIQGKELPLNLGFCIKQAVNSTAVLPIILTNYPYMPAKIFHCIDALLPKVLTLERNTYTLCRLLYAMIGSRHINVNAVKVMGEHLKSADWTKLRFKEMSSLLKDMADYGYNDVNLYKAVLAECMRERRRAEIKAFPDRLFSLLTGLAYLQIYPVELFEILFSDEDWLQEVSKLKRSRVEMLWFMEGSLKLNCPEYRGPFLPDFLAQREGYSNRTINRGEGITQLHDVIIKVVKGYCNKTYSVQRRRVVDFVLYDDIELQCLESGQKWAVVVYDWKSYFTLHSLVRVGFKTSKYDVVGYRLTGLNRCRPILLKKMGYNVIEMRYEDHFKCRNLDDYVRNELKKGGVI